MQKGVQGMKGRGSGGVRFPSIGNSRACPVTAQVVAEVDKTALSVCLETEERAKDLGLSSFSMKISRVWCPFEMRPIKFVLHAGYRT
jgi:hypothetical protein